MARDAAAVVVRNFLDAAANMVVGNGRVVGVDALVSFDVSEE